MSHGQRRVRLILGLSIYLLTAGWGLCQLFHPESGVLYLAFALGFPLTTTYWCIVDGRILRRPVLYSFYWLIFFFWPIALPAYLVWSRKWRGFGLALVHAIGLYGVCFGAYNLAAYFVYGPIWFHRPN